MTKKVLERADRLFLKLSKIAPCLKCSCVSCEECRWTTFAADRIGRSHDFYNDEYRSEPIDGKAQKEGR